MSDLWHGGGIRAPCGGYVHQSSGPEGAHEAVLGTSSRNFVQKDGSEMVIHAVEFSK
jgi:hypothetical protein